MKKLFAYITLVLMLAGAVPSVALADLQCYSSTSNYADSVPVQSRAACLSYDPKGILYDTSAGTWTAPNGDPVSSQPSGIYTCNTPTGDFYTVYSKTDCQGGALTDQSGSLVNTSPQGTPTASTPSSSSGGKLTYTPLEPLPGDKGNATYNSLSAYLTLMFNILLSIGAAVAVVSLVLAGITYMVSEVVDRKSEARRRMQAALIGLLLLLTCWLILFNINPDLTKFCLLNLDQQCGAAAPATTYSTQNASASTPATPSQNDNSACQNQGKTIQYTDTGWSCQ